MLLLSTFLLTLAAPAHAQGGRSSDNILFPQPPRPVYIGLTGGNGWWTNEASFGVSDNGMTCALFSDAKGEGPFGGLKSFLYLTRWLAISPRATYEERSGRYFTPLEGEPVRDRNDSVVILSEEAQVDATMAAFMLDLRLVLDIGGSGIYLCAGPAGGLLVDGFFDYTERITGPPGFVFSDTRENEFLLVRKRSFDHYEKYVFDLRAGGGFIISIGRFAINPEFTYSYPLTSSFAEPDKMKQTGLLGSVGIYNFGE